MSTLDSVQDSIYEILRRKVKHNDRRVSRYKLKGVETVIWVLEEPV
jgi:hypothetical protein